MATLAIFSVSGRWFFCPKIKFAFWVLMLRHSFLFQYQHTFLATNLFIWTFQQQFNNWSINSGICLAVDARNVVFSYAWTRSNCAWHSRTQAQKDVFNGLGGNEIITLCIIEEEVKNQNRQITFNYTSDRCFFRCLMFTCFGWYTSPRNVMCKYKQYDSIIVS